MSLHNLRIVLVQPHYSGNFGAVARAMRNMGIHELTLVNPAPVRRAQADMMAVHAREVLDAMSIHTSLRSAIGDCGLVVGTTCRSGLYRDHAVSPRSLAPRIASTAATNRVALVFGSEESGLTNDDLRLCHQLITIPTDSSYMSLNIAQAVLVCCYEVFLAIHLKRPGELVRPALDAQFTLRRLTADDQPALEVLRGRCTEVEIDDAYVEIEHELAWGCFRDQQLLAVGSAYPRNGFMDYGVLTDPELRGQGLARHVVCALTDDTLERGLIPQYRCNRVNKASRRVAEAAGFTLYYTTESVKLRA